MTHPTSKVAAAILHACLSANTAGLAGVAIRVNSDLVLLPVSVTDARNRPVTGLSRETFRVFEGDIERNVVHFSSEDAPISVGIVFDSSGSMRDKVSDSRAALREFVRTANPADEFFLVEFSGSPRVRVPFTSDPDEIQRNLATAATGKTALLDAVYLALDYMKGARHSRRALLVISDGGENGSRYSQVEVASLVRETDVWIYAVGIYPRTLIDPEEMAIGPHLLGGLADSTGGRQYTVHSPSQLPDVTRQISLELRNRYVLGFSPSTQGLEGKFQRVRVRVSGQGRFRVASRHGYYVPAAAPGSRQK